jgi:hypothetical protein
MTNIELAELRRGHIIHIYIYIYIIFFYNYYQNKRKMALSLLYLSRTYSTKSCS